MCHVTKYSTILGVFLQPWPGVSPTAILNEEKALGTRLGLMKYLKRRELKTNCRKTCLKFCPMYRQTLLTKFSSHNKKRNRSSTLTRCLVLLIKRTYRIYYIYFTHKRCPDVSNSISNHSNVSIRVFPKTYDQFLNIKYS